MRAVPDAGGLRGVVGLALGDFHPCRPDGARTLDDILKEQLGLLDILVGHSVHNHAFPHGAPGRLDGEGLTFPSP